jgi:phospho-N-acetylmuramoyl-pentapeptide-transferase
MDQLAINVVKIFIPGFLAFILAFLLTPILTHFLYKYKFWRKEVRTKAIDGGELPFFKKFHSENEIKTPRGAGVLFWLTTLILALFFLILSEITNIWWFEELNFLSREQTWLPLFALVVAGLIGLIDDILQIVEKSTLGVFGKIGYIGGGLSLKIRLLLMVLFGLIGGLWFYFELGEEWRKIFIPGIGYEYIGFWIIPLFILVMLAVYSGGVIDGLDGLAGGTFASIFAAFSVIAFSRGQIDLAAFCLVIVSVLLAFLWFNIPPARFYMGETGSMGLTAVITVIAFFTNSVLVLPVIGVLLVATSLSVILQLFSKKFMHKKLFLAAPIHHHFQAKNWPHYKVTMRFWLIGVVAAIAGVTIRLLG